MTVSEVRVALTVDDVDAALRFFADTLGMQQVADWSSDNGRVVVLGAPRATIELIDAKQAEYIDRVEVGRRVSGPVRLALQVPDSEAAVNAVELDGAEVVSLVQDTPWGDRNARVIAPGDLQLTLFTTGGQEEVDPW